MDSEPARADPPEPEAIRAALGRVTASEPFRASPQLVAFLGFVVNVALRGESRQIKAYTIAVEALGRPPSFDAQADSAVRVLAGRLRRALAQYYEQAGAADPVHIELTRGSYVPAFRPRPPAQASLLAQTDPPVRERVGPTVLLEPFTADPPPDRPLFVAEHLRMKLGDAMSRFDAIHVIADATPRIGADLPGVYRLSGAVEHHRDGSVTCRFRLVDGSDGAVILARVFPRLRADGEPTEAEDAVVSALSIAIADPFGAVWAQERAARATRSAHRCCMIDIIEYWRRFDPALHERMRSCLQAIIAVEPGYAAAHTGLALIHTRDHLMGITPPEGAPALDLALRSALRAIEVRPQSARARDTLAMVYFNRGDMALAFAALDHAMALNPDDMNVVANYGARLVGAGEVERGMVMLQKAAAHAKVQPAWFDFYLFLAAHLVGDADTATRYASALAGDASPLAQLATLLMARRSGAHAQAELALERLAGINPAWRSDPRSQLARFFPVPAVQERLLADIAGPPDGA